MKKMAHNLRNKQWEHNDGGMALTLSELMDNVQAMNREIRNKVFFRLQGTLTKDELRLVKMAFHLYDEIIDREIDEFITLSNNVGNSLILRMTIRDDEK